MLQRSQVRSMNAAGSAARYAGMPSCHVSHATRVFALDHRVESVGVALAAAVHESPAAAEESRRSQRSRLLVSLHRPRPPCCACTPPATSGKRVARPAGCQAVLHRTHTPALLRLRVKVEGWEVATAGAWRRRQLALLFWPARQEGRWCQHHPMTSQAQASRTTASGLAQAADALQVGLQAGLQADIGQQGMEGALEGPRAAGRSLTGTWPRKPSWS